MFVVFRASIVQTDRVTNYGNVEYKASVKNSSGTVTIQNSTALYSDLGLAHTFSVIVTGTTWRYGWWYRRPLSARSTTASHTAA